MYETRENNVTRYKPVDCFFLGRKVNPNPKLFFLFLLFVSSLFPFYNTLAAPHSYRHQYVPCAVCPVCRSIGSDDDR